MGLHSLRTCALAGGLCLAAPAFAQDVVFSITWRGPTISLPDSCFGAPITEGDLLTPAPAGVPMLGPLPPPCIAVPHMALGLAPGCAGHPAGVPCIVEVDALSYGQDLLLSPAGVLPGSLWWSVDEYAMGFPAPLPPNQASEAPVGDSSADSWVNVVVLPPGPLPPFAAPPVSVGALDGDGLPSLTGFAYPGLGLIEPNPPVFGPASLGDNLDALEVFPGGGIAAALGVFFSLDAAFPDPLTGIPNSGSAPAHGVSGADVLNQLGGAAVFAVYAPAFALGLDLAGGMDDIDALILAENGIPGYQPSGFPYDWMGGGSDMLLFSVRRGSPVVGAPDSMFGIPIEPGDILTTPVAGGASPFPAIFIAAENLGIATLRSGFGPPEELDALSSSPSPLLDCNGNGVEDAVDIALGVEADANFNGIPDSCEGPPLYSSFCFCPAVSGPPCGNADPTAGCANASGSGALLTPSGSTSVALDDLVLTATNTPPNQFGIPFYGPTPIAPVAFGDGLRCVGGMLRRFPVITSDAFGTATMGPGLVALSIATQPPAGQITIGSTWHFQYWYRTPGGPCLTNFNVTNAVSATFVP